MLELFIGLMMEFFLINYWFGITFFLSNLWFQFFAKIVIICIFPWICTQVSIFSQKESPSCKNSTPKENIGLGKGQGGVIQLFNAKHYQIMFFYFKKKNRHKTYSYIMRKNNIEIHVVIFFQSCVINQLYLCMTNVVKQI
jgi:hypothetical protein